MLGIGGGAIMVPLLVWFFEAQGLPKAHILHLAVGTAMATILFTSRAPPGFAGMSAFGFLVSAFSAFAAIGGAFMTVPFMLWCNVPMLQAIGTAAVIGFPIALSGTIGFIATGLRETGLPEYSVGFVFLPALGGIVVAKIGRAHV